MSKKQEPTLMDRALAVGLWEANLIAWVERVETLIEQRDDLLAALEKVGDDYYYGMLNEQTRIAIYDAIASVKEKK